MSKAYELAVALCLSPAYPDQALIARAVNELLRLDEECNSERRAREYVESELTRAREQLKAAQTRAEQNVGEVIG